MKYEDYLKGLVKQFNNQIEAIVAQYNFDLGPEFEIALCKVLRKVLPQKYGICRGFVVSEDSLAGDDIVIYDRNSFPTLRFLPQDRYEQKEYIPVEAVYAYIEAKRTLHIEGDDNQSYAKAYSQVAEVKKLSREPVKLYGPRRVGWPNIANPMFGAVFATRVGRKKGESILADQDEVSRAIVHAMNEGILPETSPSPDLIVAGDSVVMIPYYRDEENPVYRNRSPFSVKGSFLLNLEVHGRAFAIGVLMLLYALEFIRLGRMPWHRLINEAMQEAEQTTIEQFLGRQVNE